MFKAYFKRGVGDLKELLELAPLPVRISGKTAFSYFMQNGTIDDKKIVIKHMNRNCLPIAVGTKKDVIIGIVKMKTTGLHRIEALEVYLAELLPLTAHSLDAILFNAGELITKDPANLTLRVFQLAELMITRRSLWITNTRFRIDVFITYVPMERIIELLDKIIELELKNKQKTNETAFTNFIVASYTTCAYENYIISKLGSELSSYMKIIILLSLSDKSNPNSDDVYDTAVNVIFAFQWDYSYFEDYHMYQIVNNSKAIAEALIESNYDIDRDFIQHMDPVHWHANPCKTMRELLTRKGVDCK